MRNVSMRAYAYALHTVIWCIVVTTVATEQFPAFKSLLANIFSHHWIAKSDLAVIVFLVVALLFARREDPEDVTPLVKGVLISTILGTLAILVFYLFHFFTLV